MQPLSYAPSKKQQGQEPPFHPLESSLSLRGIITFHLRNIHLASDQKSVSTCFSPYLAKGACKVKLCLSPDESAPEGKKVHGFAYLGIVFETSVSSDIDSLTSLSKHEISYSQDSSKQSVSNETP